ncbi:hypothetical protein [Tenuifilum osseticum]|uniref:hypothetical protein n=1 Tax=Tenuifilum osseticum TaxID=3374723 RepID=UPI0034E56F4F
MEKQKKYNPTHKSIHILLPRISARRPKLQKEYAFLQPEKNGFKKIPFPLKNFKNANPHSETKTIGQLVAKLITDNGFKTRTTRTPACNSVYVAIAGEVVNLSSVHLRNFVLNGQVSASNPLLHIHANRYRQV